LKGASAVATPLYLLGKFQGEWVGGATLLEEPLYLQLPSPALLETSQEFRAFGGSRLHRLHHTDKPLQPPKTQTTMRMDGWMDGWMLSNFGHEKQFSVGFHFPTKLWWACFSSQTCLLALLLCLDSL
jgi:hypothetical protein